MQLRRGILRRKFQKQIDWDCAKGHCLDCAFGGEYWGRLGTCLGASWRQVLGVAGDGLITYHCCLRLWMLNCRRYLLSQLKRSFAIQQYIQFNTLVFGRVCKPFGAIRCLFWLKKKILKSSREFSCTSRNDADLRRVLLSFIHCSHGILHHLRFQTFPDKRYAEICRDIESV